MSQFQIVPDASVILFRQGVEREVPVAHRKGRLYAKHGVGWAKLSGHGQLAVKGMSWSDLASVPGIWCPEGSYPRYVDPDMDGDFDPVPLYPDRDDTPELTDEVAAGAIHGEPRDCLVDKVRRAFKGTKPTPT